MIVSEKTLFSRTYTAGVLAASKEIERHSACPDHGRDCENTCPWLQGWVDWMSGVVKVNEDGSWSKVDV
jgi:hypothetical protein